jgi:hypothetical protein
MHHSTHAPIRTTSQRPNDDLGMCAKNDSVNTVGRHESNQNHTATTSTIIHRAVNRKRGKLMAGASTRLSAEEWYLIRSETTGLAGAKGHCECRLMLQAADGAAFELDHIRARHHRGPTTAHGTILL